MRQVKPKVAIPHHYRWEGYVEQFSGMFSRVRRVNGDVVGISKDTLKSGLEIVVLKDPLGGSRIKTPTPAHSGFPSHPSSLPSPQRGEGA